MIINNPDPATRAGYEINRNMSMALKWYLIHLNNGCPNALRVSRQYEATAAQWEKCADAIAKAEQKEAA